MNYKRAIGYALLNYVVSFIAVIAAGAFVGFDISSGEEVHNQMFWIMGALVVVITGIMAKLYFKSNTTGASFENGLRLGAVFIFVGAILDLLLLLPQFFVTELLDNPLDYFVQGQFWVAVALMLFVAGAMGQYVGQKRVVKRAPAKRKPAKKKAPAKKKK